MAYVADRMRVVIAWSRYGWRVVIESHRSFFPHSMGVSSDIHTSAVVEHLKLAVGRFKCASAYIHAYNL